MDILKLPIYLDGICRFILQEEELMKRLALCSTVLLVMIALMPVHALYRDTVDKEGWYIPLQADFHAEYDRDKANQSAQTWDDYWGWVVKFYNGVRVWPFYSDPGWTNRCKDIIKPIKAQVTRHDIQVTLNGLGRDISKEWAKDNDHRKIDTHDIHAWGDQMQQATKADKGTGDRIKRAIQAIREQVDKKLGKKR